MRKGFTLIEALLIIGILFILFFVAFPNFRFFQKESDLKDSSEEIINTLRLAQSKTLASEGASRWGVYFETSTLPHQYILFKGESFANRDVLADEIHKLPNSIEIYEIDLWGGKEVVFEKVTGYASSTSQVGKVSIRLKSDPTKNETIYIENSGLVRLTNPTSVSDSERIKDSRHVHFDYTRQISTSTETIILTFTYGASTTVKEIIIAENMKDNQIYWDGEVNVGGEIQKLKIHTHRLNDPIFGTQFCIHRDRRYNNRALKVEISGDSGDLIEYDAEGGTEKGNSFYVSDPVWQ
jgi:type II secretory pathway pseudopilin PulG